MRILFRFFMILFFGLSQAQELNCTVTVNYDKITNANAQVFKTLQNSLNEFVNKTSWTTTVFKPTEKINCSMYITLSSYNATQFTGTLQVQSSRPIFNSSYSSPVLSINDKDFTFKYTEYENLIFNPSSFDSNLVSVIAFYSYIILGTDADTFSESGGTSYLEQAQDVANVAIQGGYKGWSQSDGNQNRFFLINDMLSTTFKPYREAMFEYHFEGLDTMHENVSTGKEAIKLAIGTLAKINDSRPNAFLTRVFFDTKSDEIVSIFSSGPTIETSSLVETLNKISPLNSGKWSFIK